MLGETLPYGPFPRLPGQYINDKFEVLNTSNIGLDRKLAIFKQSASSLAATLILVEKLL